MQLVDNDTFLQELGKLFESTQKSGSIWLTHKRLTHDGEDANMSAEDDETKEYPILVRATDGREISISTRVAPGQLEQFHSAYGALLKASMTTLRKRDKKREKQKAEEVARKKRRLAEEVIVEGPKRGAGRKKRQRKMKALAKQEETRKRIHERREGQARGKSEP
ncbi:signal recognition particle SRP9/SRP14 subunit [Wolfiporia cocos MD-104 SS10]|uniref:Signal recognition particle subunit SRP14 n=1 Tax=Wolfiporia cocos (strain MD-104) TaxID=742152 RepID=A0A2H3IWD8_WOLCO|nr:signal recognition particle SRP9/SRP14 subunit [Wolfiporia cocos MD-104 SS10]